MDSTEKVGQLIWITGLSGSGKTTIARALGVKLGPHIHLDGDQFRQVMGDDLGHTPKDRLKNAYRIARMGHLLARQGHIVICSTVSLYNEIHELNRREVENYWEIWVECALEELLRRNQKGLYAQGEQVVGVDLPYDRPKSPHLVIDNTHIGKLEEKVESILHVIAN